MHKFLNTLALSGIATLAGIAAATAASPVLVAGIYGSTGVVASNNGAASCSQVGLAVNSANNSIVTFPGAGKTGFAVTVVPGAGSIQLCTGFAAVPAGGISNFTSQASCAVDSLNGNIPAQPVTFTFTSTTTSPNSTIGKTTVAIPATDALGGGCTATVNTTIVRTGK